MARGRRAATSLAQTEIEGTESPGRDPELHALALELYELQERSMEWRKKDAQKRKEIAAALKERDLDSYDCDGVSLWLKGSDPKVKVSVSAPEDD